MVVTYFRQLKLPLEIKKSNSLVRAEVRVKNNPLANKLFAALVRAISPDRFPEISTIDTVTLIPLKSGDGGHDYRLIREACNTLMDAKIEITSGTRDKFILMAIVMTIEYDRGQIKAKFNPDLKPHLLNLQNFYTNLNFFELTGLKGFYAPRLFEILKSWENVASKVVEIDLDGKGGLYHSLSVPESLRQNYKDLRRVLEKAHKEIIEKTSLKYSWEPLKRSRKVVAIRFYFGGDEQRAKIAKSYAEKKRSIRNQARKNNTLAKLVIACLKEHDLSEGSGKPCPYERLTLAHCKLCARWREPNLLTITEQTPIHLDMSSHYDSI